MCIQVNVYSLQLYSSIQDKDFIVKDFANLLTLLQFNKMKANLFCRVFLHLRTLVYWADLVSGPLANLVGDPCSTVIMCEHYQPPGNTIATTQTTIVTT